MRLDVVYYVRSYAVCSQVKPEQKLLARQLSGRPNVTQPWELICMDIVGPRLRSSNGNAYI